MKGQASIAVTRAMPRALVKKKKDFKKTNKKFFEIKIKHWCSFYRRKNPKKFLFKQCIKRFTQHSE